MAIYHFHGKAVCRSKGHSAVAAAAYRAGDRLYDARRGCHQAYLIGHTTKECPALDLIDQGMTIDTLYYPYVLRVRYTPPRLLSLVYFDAVFTIAGRHLDELRRLIRDRLVSEVHVFNTQYFDPPLAHMPLIEKILLEPRRPPAPQTVQ